MKITFYGAAGMVTGSCFLVETEKTRVLVDCGLFQGSKEINRLNYAPLRFDPRGVPYLLLTHAHIDHSGLIPKLVRKGFSGRIITTAATADLCEIMLEDSAHVQEIDTEHENRRRKRQGLEPRSPLYTREDAAEAMERFETVAYDEKTDLGDGIEVRFRDAGHILGSALLELFVAEGGKTRKIVFSGDLGQWDVPIIRDPTLIEEADCVVMESTYGGRRREDVKDREDQLRGYIEKTYRRGGKLMIPSFAVERTQELIYAFKKLINGNEFPGEKIFLDSPLAIKATEVFKKHRECFDREALTLFEHPFTFPELVYSVTAEDSMRLNEHDEPCVIIAGSGMCTGGRIKHHFKHGLWDSSNTVLFVGYQANGTLGRIILDGADEVKLLGTSVVVKAEVGRIEGFSAHADAGELLKWADGFKGKPEKVFVVHGEEDQAAALKSELESRGLECRVPGLGESAGCPG